MGAETQKSVTDWIQKKETSEAPLPPDEIFQILRPPKARKPRDDSSISLFRLRRKPGEDTDPGDGQDEPEEEPETELQEWESRGRYVIPANGEVMLEVVFRSPEICKVDMMLEFEVVGSQKSYPLHLTGICAVPTINSTPTAVYERIVKKRPKVKSTRKFKPAFLLAEELFSFGPLI